MDGEKYTLPRYSTPEEYASLRRRRFRRRFAKVVVAVLLGLIVFSHWAKDGTAAARSRNSLLSVQRLHADYDTCSKLRNVPKDPIGLGRERNARHIEGQKPILIRNATVWTGEPLESTSPEDARTGKGYAWVQADVLMEYGLIKLVHPAISSADLPPETTVYDARGRLLTAGIVDMHSHAGVDPLPGLEGSSDDNELSNDITPYVRSIDGLNPLDPHLKVAKSGGVTTSLILPGSGNNIGGEAFVVKHAVGKEDGRPQLSAEDMLADPEKNWRYIKMACGENAKRVYGRLGRDFGPFSRLGEAWYFRHAFEQARALVNAQDDWCAAADRVGAENMQSYLPMELKWESLGAVLRGQVHVNTHCYTVPDLEAFVKHSNEFQFPIRAFHHAHQTYLVPEILKKAYGGRPPAAALFADNMYYKAEAYVGSEQAGKILWENGLTPVYVSDNPVLNSQHVVFEAAKAYRYGLPYHVALAGVTSASAELLGLGEKIGKVKPGFDADVVVWDSDPLEIGATPVQVWIDGSPQFEEPVELRKPTSKPLEPTMDLQDTQEGVTELKDVVFTGISRSLLMNGADSLDAADGDGKLVVRNGTIKCIGLCLKEKALAQEEGFKTIHLRDGHVAPAFTAFGSFLGIEEISAEEDTRDGSNGDNTFSAAIDGLSLGGKPMQAAYAHGVTKAISAPSFSGGGHKGLSAGFRTGASFAGEKGAVFKDQVALHYTLTLGAKQGKTPSISSAVGDLREKLLKAVKANVTDETTVEEKNLIAVVGDELPLVITVHSADTITHLLRVKEEVEKANDGKAIRLITFGAAESYLLADELAAANVGVVLAPFQPYAVEWDQRRSLPGAPLSNGSAVDVLHAAGVKLAISTSEDWETRVLGLYAGIAHANGGEKISEKEAMAFVSSNIYGMLGLKKGDTKAEYVVYEGNPLKIDSRVKAVADGRGSLTVFGQRVEK
jgi:imidazolonepropionase-like amidohydrolase